MSLIDWNGFRSKSQSSTPPPLCAFDTQLRVTHPLLELSLGCLEEQALTAGPLLFERPPSSKFTQISRAERLKFTQKSADDHLFTRPGSQNAILKRNTQRSNWICQKLAAEIVKTSKYLLPSQSTKATLPTPVLWSQLPITHPLHTVGSL